MGNIANSFGFSEEQLKALQREVNNRILNSNFEEDEANSIPIDDYDEHVHVPAAQGTSTRNAANHLTPEQIRQNTDVRVASLDMAQDIIVQKLSRLEDRIVYLEGKVQEKR